MIAFYILVAFAMVVCIGISVNTHGYFDKNIFTGYDVVLYNDGWYGQDGQKLQLPGSYSIPAGQYMRMNRTVTQADIDEVFARPAFLLFRTDHTFVRAYVNGVEIYRFGEAERIPVGKTPGSGWQLIELGLLEAGDVIELETMCPYDKYSGQWRDIISGSKAELLSYILMRGLVMLLLTIIPLIIGLALLMLSPIFAKWGIWSKALGLGLAFLIISLWSFTETRTWQLFLENAYFIQMLSFTTFTLFLPCVVLAFHLLGIIPDSKIYRRTMVIDSVVLFMLILLQLFNLADFFETLAVIHVLIVINGILFLTMFVRNSDKSNEMARNIGIGMYFVLVLCCACDLMDFYVWDYFGNGFFTRLELISLLVCSGIVSARKALGIYEADIEKRAFEKMAYTDNLTSLRNRRGFDEDLDAIDRDKDAVTIVYGDMNGLKYINDNLGHHLGDEALKLIGSCLNELAWGEHGKKKKKRDRAYRFGGDEYCVLCFDRTPEELEREMEALNKRLSAEESRYHYPIGISYGIVRYEPAEGRTVRQGVTEADRKMYDYKENLYKTRKRYR